MHTGAKACVENSPHCSWAKNISLRGGVPPADPGGLICANLWLRRWGPLAVLHAQQGGDCAHEYGRLCRRRDLPVQQGGLSLRGVGPPAEAGGLICAKLLRRLWGPLAVLHAKPGGDGAREYGRQVRGGELPAPQL